jgi:GNAT superfamily N-acetyltransferase
MTAAIEYRSNNASEAEIAEHLLRGNAAFVPPLSSRVEINDYAKKITNQATRFEAWSGGILIGLIAAYCNDQKSRVAFITSVSVLSEWAGKGVAAHLLNQCIEHAKTMGMQQISLEVASNNTRAIQLYEKTGFILNGPIESFVTMSRDLTSGEKHG